MVPGIVIAYVLPMIPYVIWIAGVCGWIILVCEAMIAVPLWMLAHMTLGGDGLHGRAVEGWSLLLSVVFRPSLMLIGLFLSYFVFDCMSWLLRDCARPSAPPADLRSTTATSSPTGSG